MSQRLCAPAMRILLLLSALFTALAGAAAPARAAGVPAEQVRTLVAAVAARAAVATAGRRPAAVLPVCPTVMQIALVVAAPAQTTPLYALRMRI